MTENEGAGVWLWKVLMQYQGVASGWGRDGILFDSSWEVIGTLKEGEPQG